MTLTYEVGFVESDDEWSRLPCAFVQAVTIPAELTVVQLEEVIELVRNDGVPALKGRTLTVELRAIDLWDLALVVFDLRDALSSYGVDMNVDREHVSS
jgi:hypothetical protein